MSNSFDVYLADGSSLTAEHAGSSWDIFWLDELGENRVNYGKKVGSRCEVMIHVENMAAAFDGENRKGL